MTEQLTGALAGLRVLDLTSHPPGATCTVMLADLGAEVVRVEPPAQKGKPSLVIGQVALSRGKRSLTLDMRASEAPAILSRLAARFDIIVEASRPGSMQARGFAYDQAKAANPGIIWCAITGFGQEGPYAAHGGHDSSYLAHSGLLAALSIEQPFHPAISVASQAGALSAVIAIQSALLEKTRTGDGAFIDISLSEAATWFLTCGINALSSAPYMIAPSPDRRLYVCEDGRWVAIASQEPRTWTALCTILGFPQYADRLHRSEQAEATTADFAQAFLAKPAAEWIDILSAAGAAVTIVNHASQLLEDPQVLARGSIAMVGDTPVPANPIRYRNSTGLVGTTAISPPHTVGQDSEDVFASAGFSTDEISELRKKSLI